MAQPRKGPRLYFDQTRQRWAIRDGIIFIRTRYREHQTELANSALWRYIHARKIERIGRLIYFVTCDVHDFPIKIGMSSNVQERLRDLATALPYSVRLLGLMTGDSKVEAEIQARWARIWLRGEWYERTPELLRYVAESATVPVPFPCHGVSASLTEEAKSA